ncbi:helix-turn-helix domain-containing protein [Vibrio ishigakensis]|uniref:helix-turn-helix domain-containing protein n=1 Tax=Vibrio ishigakensis TaxID=1481914 RepID=UPI0021C28201|nr:AraC family transcriptional regulator [Vibrio ishigakensis]
MKASSNTLSLLVTSTRNVVPYVEYCDAKGLDWRSVAKECGIPVELMLEGEWLPTNDLMVFLHKLEMKYGYLVSVEVGRNTKFSQLSPELDRKLKACKSFGEGIQLIISEMPKFNNHVVFWTEFRDGRWWLCHRSGYRPSTLGFEQAEWSRTLNAIQFCKLFLGKKWQPESAKFISAGTNAHRLPKHFHNTELLFEQSYGAIAIPLPESYQAVPAKQVDLVWHQAVDRLIDTYAILPWFNIDWFAEMLGMTKRTLQRNLKNAGITFKEAKDKARMGRAKQYLLDTNLSVQEISYQVGYTDLSNFNRAFKRWTGLTAPNYRNEKK